MGLKDLVKSAVRDLAEDRRDDGAPPTAVAFVKDGCASDGRRVLSDTGDVVLGAEERLVLRADFKRLGLAVLFPKSVTSATRSTIFDLEKDADVTVTSQRLVVVVDDLSTKGGWSGGGLGLVVAAGANLAHAAASKIRHRGEAAVFEVPLTSINRVLAPSSPTFEWSGKRCVEIGWNEKRNIGTGSLRMVLLDQRRESDHMDIARRIGAAVGAASTGDKVDWRR